MAVRRVADGFLAGWFLPVLDPAAFVAQEIGRNAVSRPPAPDEAGTRAVLARLSLALRHRLTQAPPGEHRAFVKGQGLDFANLREYVPGDDIRKIDWNVFARTFMPHVREYREDKQLTLWLFADMTPSMRFGAQVPKASRLVEVAALLSLLAQEAGHKLGLFAYTGSTREVLTPQAGVGQVHRVYETLARLAESHESENAFVSPEFAGRMAGELARLVSKHNVVVALGDFLGSDSSWDRALGKLARSSTLLFLRLADRVEAALPDAGWLVLRDSETGAVAEVDTAHPQTRARYQQAFACHESERLAALRALAPVVTLWDDASPLEALWKLLGGRDA